jgi:hypothetical protein
MTSSSRRTLLLGSAVAGALLLPARAEGQVCTGRPGAGVGSIQADAEFESFDGGRAASAGLRAVGQELFLGAAVGSARSDALSGSTITIAGAVGYEYRLGPMGRFGICPIIGGALGFGPLDVDESGYDAGSRGVSVGAGLGYVAFSSPRLTLLPTASVSLVRVSNTLDDGFTIIKTVETFGTASFGVGAVLGRKFVVQPWVLVPYGLEEAVGASVGMTVALTIGRRY